MENEMTEKFQVEQLPSCGAPSAGAPAIARDLSPKRDPFPALKSFFGYDSFRTYNNEPLQESAVRAALAGDSVLTIFPTGGGKSITFQLPALIEWMDSRALTVVISPLQSLMKDQVDNLLKHHITEAATINGLLTQVERSKTVNRIESGDVAILYVSPEQLRSGSFMRLMRKRKIARFVIDEAHCFSSWGHDFRVDYLYIGEFLRELRQIKCLKQAIPVSCFTATAKQQVINEIIEYFQEQNGISLRLFKTEAERTNLHYHVTPCVGETEKYEVLHRLISERERPTIIYVGRTNRAEELAAKLTEDHIPSLPFHGQMDSKSKIENQNAFIKNQIRVMVATSAFGMGVDKKDVGLVIHHDISSSLEAYLQESGRAGRDPALEADCHLLYNENDLDEHFSLFSKSQITIEDINSIWKAIKKFTTKKMSLSCSAYEIAKCAGWNVYGEERIQEIETKVYVCISALERSGFLRRTRNAPISFANSIRESDLDVVKKRIDESASISIEDRALCFRLMSHLVSAHKMKSSGEATEEEVATHTQIDQLAAKFVTSKRQILYGVNLLREIDLLSDDLDMTATIPANSVIGHLIANLNRIHKLESIILSRLQECASDYNLKEINDIAGLAETGICDIRSLLDLHVMRHDIRLHNYSDSHNVRIQILRSRGIISSEIEQRYDLCKFILTEIVNSSQVPLPSEKETRVNFSVVNLMNAYKETNKLEIRQKNIEEALLFLMQNEIIGLTGGFLVAYKRLQIERIVRNDKVEYSEEDYAPFRNFFQQKNEGVHIVGEYARLMIENPDVAKTYVQDYFNLDLEAFIKKHFKGLHAREIKRRMTDERYKTIFGSLSDTQRTVLDNHESKIVTVVGTPGSGKTHLLVRKIASLLLLQEYSAERLLLLTFNRSTANDLKRRLVNLIGNTAFGVEVKCFQSYAMDILGRMQIKTNSRYYADCSDGYDGYIAEKGCVFCASESVKDGRTEQHRITKSVLLIDDAQEMGKDEYSLVQALMLRNADIQLFAVGDDDQKILSNSNTGAKYFKKLGTLKGAKRYELNENYRSPQEIVEFSNAYVSAITNRLKHQSPISLSNNPARVEVVEYASENMEEQFVNSIIENKSAVTGTCAVLAHTNNDAVILSGLLLQRGVRAKLIQTDDRVKLRDLAEMRYFIRRLKDCDSSITPGMWNAAAEKLFEKYSNSACLGTCRTILEKFRSFHELDFSLGEFEEFLNESSFEDFRDTRENVVIVSTFQKIKGHEFDSVYMFLKNFEVTNDDKRRLLYVAMTRAKRNLFIHCNTPIFSEIKNRATSYNINSELNLPPPDILSFVLTHHDMNLGYSRNYKKEILELQSGASLSVSGEFVFSQTPTGTVPVGKFSGGFVQRLSQLTKAGYVPIQAKVLFVLAWRGRNDEKESAILIPYITLKRKSEVAA